MSAFITPIAPISVDTAIQPEAGTITRAIGDASIVVTDPNADLNQPIVIDWEAVTAGINNSLLNIASGTEGADIIIDGDSDGTIEIGNAVDANGNILSASGTTFQVAEDYQGTVIANLDGAITDGTKVDLNTETTSGNSIADALGGPLGFAVPIDEPRLNDSTNSEIIQQIFTTPGDVDVKYIRPKFAFDYYHNTGAADDQVGGSQGSDFIRLGAGDDTFNAGSGDDIVRMGSGNDRGSLGDGSDVAYFTIDQLQGEQLKVITDFDSAGNDKIAINGNLINLIDIDGIGTESIVINLSGAQTGTTTITSEGEDFDEDDIEFIF